MTRRGVSRLLLVLLCGLAVAFVFRSCVTATGHDSFVDFGGGWDEDRLRHEAFRLDRPVRLAIDATGSFETDSALAAYGWIVRREDRAVVWQMTPQGAVRDRATLAVTADTVTLGAGTYDAYFATFGDPLLPVQGAESVGEWMAGLLRFGNRAWESDQSKWAFRIDPVHPGDDAFAHRLTGADERDAAPAGPGLVWAGGPAGHRDDLAYSFTVSEPTALRIDAIGELYRGQTDYGWIADLVTGERVWEMTPDNTEPAGGSVKNRRFRGTLDLAPGLYRATFETDAVRCWASEHGYRWLNLGGGVGSGADSLLDYKLGFSSTTRPFHTWRWVVDQASYDAKVAHAGIQLYMNPDFGSSYTLQNILVTSNDGNDRPLASLDGLTPPVWTENTISFRDEGIHVPSRTIGETLTEPHYIYMEDVVVSGLSGPDGSDGIRGFPDGIEGSKWIRLLQ